MTPGATAPTPSARRLIVNADDLGLAASVNRGILETMESGIVTSASLMVNMGAHGDAMRRLFEAMSRGLRVSIGLHFNIVAGDSLTPTPTLTRAGSRAFLPLTALAWRAFTGRVDGSDVERELEAQLARARQQLEPLGMRVTHIDSHRHAHCLPGIFDIVLRVAARHGIPHVRHPTESSGTLLGKPLALLATGVLRVVLTRRRALDEIGFAGFALMGSKTLDRDLARLLETIPAGTTELMVHPGYDSTELAALDPYRQEREREVQALTAPAAKARLRELGMVLTHFGATAPPG